MRIHDIIREMNAAATPPLFTELYGGDEVALCHQRERYTNAVRRFAELYPGREDVGLFSAPGRTEIGGNHTDHQHGCVLAAAVGLDAIAVVAFHDDGVIRINSEGYEPFAVSLADLSVGAGRGDSASIVRGIASRFIEKDLAIGGFDAYITSDVLSGSGISSSAAFETLIGTIIDLHYNSGRAGAVEIARIGQYAENVYFGKNSGLMDQMVSSAGGLVAIDFSDTQNPQIRGFQFDFERSGYRLCITDTTGSHAGLTGDYAAVRAEMESVAAYFGKSYLREVDEEAFYALLPDLRKGCSDRAILRAAHFFAENRRARLEAAALERGSIDEFLELVRQSGESSETLLQNLYSPSSPTRQEIPLGIMLSRRILGGRGAVRVHGGGFAGTIQAFVPIDVVEEYICGMNRVFGAGSCARVRIRSLGGVEITPVLDLL